MSAQSPATMPRLPNVNVAPPPPLSMAKANSESTSRPVPSTPLKATAPKAAPVTAGPPPRQSPSPKNSDSLLRDVLKGIELPPDAPKLGEIAPPAPSTPSREVESYRPDLTAQKLSNRIRDLKIPEVPLTSPTIKSAPKPQVAAMPTQPAIPQELLEKLQRPIEEIRRPPEAKAFIPKEFHFASSRPVSQPQTATASSENQELTLTTAIQGSGPEGNPYWALIQQKINSKWVAPPVDLTQHSLQVVIRFKMDQSGKVSDVAVEQSSGNDYYDNAGKRAVLAADPLPPFPKEITQRQLSPKIFFTVGDRTG
jgi:TonB family protein